MIKQGFLPLRFLRELLPTSYAPSMLIAQLTQEHGLAFLSKLRLADSSLIHLTNHDFHHFKVTEVFSEGEKQGETQSARASERTSRLGFNIKMEKNM